MIRRIILCVAGMLLSGCVQFGPKMVGPAHFNYNRAIFNSVNTEMLFNLVRLRYNEPPLFLGINSVVVQYEYRGSAGLSPIFVGGGNNELRADAALSYSERPTLSYTPLQGQDYTKQVLTPVAPQALFLLADSGWDARALFTLGVESINGVRNFPGAPARARAPACAEFLKVVDALNSLQEAGAFEASVQREAGKTNVVMMLNANTEPKAAEAADQFRDMLGLDPTGRVFRIVPGMGRGAPDQIRLQTRSLMGAMFFLAQGVELPAEHAGKNLAVQSCGDDGRPFSLSERFDGLFTVHASRDEPANAFLAVRHRNTWFYIADDDLKSKQTWALLEALILLQSTDRPAETPLVVIPAGS